jgi:CHC2 zinc finger
MAAPSASGASAPMGPQMLSAEQVASAQAVNIGDVAIERGFTFDRKGDHAGPCPLCGGTDRFSISVRKGVFLCRQCQPKGGGGAIGLVMFLDGVGFREAVETLTSRRGGRAQVRVVSPPIAPIRRR